MTTMCRMLRQIIIVHAVIYTHYYCQRIRKVYIKQRNKFEASMTYNSCCTDVLSICNMHVSGSDWCALDKYQQ